LFGAVHGSIGGIDQGVRVLAVAWINRNPDAGPDLDAPLLTAELQWCGNRSNDLSGDDFCLLAPGDVGQDYGEFVATDAGHGVGFAYLVQDSAGNRLQQLVAGAVSKAVVDLLEPVQVKVEQRELARVASG